MTQRGAEIKDTDSTGPREREAAANGAETRGGGARPSPFSMRKRIGSTAYEVEVHFSPAAGETMDDKILRLVRGGTVKGKDGENEKSDRFDKF